MSGKNSLGKWPWDIGAVGMHDMDSHRTMDPGQDFHHLQAAKQAEDANLETLQTDNSLIDLVRSKTKKSIGRTVDIPLMCGKTTTGYSVAFGVLDDCMGIVVRGNRVDGVRADRVQLIWVGPDVDAAGHAVDRSGAVDRIEYRLTGSGTTGAPDPVQCEHGWNTLGRLWLFRRGIAALKMTRPCIGMHEPKR